MRAFILSLLCFSSTANTACGVDNDNNNADDTTLLQGLNRLVTHHLADEDAGVMVKSEDSPPNIGTICTGGLRGRFQGGYVCCPSSCGTCGGRGCAGRPGGKNNCCVQVIQGNGQQCPRYPDGYIRPSDGARISGHLPIEEGCIGSAALLQDAKSHKLEEDGSLLQVDTFDENSVDEDAGIVEMSEMSPPSIGTICTGGLRGRFQGGYVCCPSSCGTCGGRGCAGRPGGKNNCCVQVIQGNGQQCPRYPDGYIRPSDGARISGHLPIEEGCIGSASLLQDAKSQVETLEEPDSADEMALQLEEDIALIEVDTLDENSADEDAGIVEMSETSPPSIGTICTDGLRGRFQGGYVCCPSSCGTCGGRGCAGRPGGKNNCCVHIIQGNGQQCPRYPDGYTRPSDGARISGHLPITQGCIGSN